MNTPSDHRTGFARAARGSKRAGSALVLALVVVAIVASMGMVFLDSLGLPPAQPFRLLAGQ